MDRTARFYSRPSYAHGGAFPIFSGSRRRRGGGILGALASVAMPMLRGLASRGAKQAIGLAKDVASDVMSGRDFKSSLMSHGMRRAKRLGSDVMGSVLNGQSSTMVSRKRRPPPRKARQRSSKRRRANF